MYEKVSTKLDFTSREEKVLKFWKENEIFEKSIEEKKDLPTYTFYDGPPTANGKPHIGHVLTRVIKDMIPRYQTMKGHKIIRKAGWDTHGLPVELEIEKELGIDGKEQIEAYGLDPFIRKCKESVWKYKGMWEEFSGKVGFWADMDDPLRFRSLSEDRHLSDIGIFRQIRFFSYRRLLFLWLHRGWAMLSEY